MDPNAETDFYLEQMINSGQLKAIIETQLWQKVQPLAWAIRELGKQIEELK